MQRSLAQFDLSPGELEIVMRAIADGSSGKPAVVLDEWGPSIDPLVRARRSRVAERVKVESAAYLTKAAAAQGFTAQQIIMEIAGRCAVCVGLATPSP